MTWRDVEARSAVGPGARWLVRAVVLASLGLGACRDPERASGTALYVTTEFDSALLLTQLEVSGTVQDDGPVEPRRLPAQPDRFLQNGETFRVLLPSAPDGAAAELSLRGLRDGVPVAAGQGSAKVRAGYEVDVTVRLQAASPTPSGDGGMPDAGGLCGGCAAGCCLDGVCTPSTFNTCGSGGVACARCDARTTDTCLPQGVCGCGGGPSCTWAMVDQCASGQCRCGGGAACGSGQQCVNGQCRCTPESCDGCCDGNSCEPGNTRDRCGSGGQACMQCNKRCNAGGTCG